MTIPIKYYNKNKFQEFLKLIKAYNGSESFGN